MPRKAKRSGATEATGVAAPGRVVWAKLRGYPWWPCRVAPLSAVPEELAQVARTEHKPGAVVAVYFFGSHDYSLVPVDSLRELEENWKDYSRAGTGLRFARALHEVRDPERYSPAALTRALPSSSPASRTEAAKKKKVVLPVSTGEFIRLCRVRLQHLIMRTETRPADIAAAQRTILAVAATPVTLEILSQSQIGRVLRIARDGDLVEESAERAQLAASIDALLEQWRVMLADFVAAVGV